MSHTDLAMLVHSLITYIVSSTGDTYCVYIFFLKIVIFCLYIVVFNHENSISFSWVFLCPLLVEGFFPTVLWFDTEMLLLYCNSTAGFHRMIVKNHNCVLYQFVWQGSEEHGLHKIKCYGT